MQGVEYELHLCALSLGSLKDGLLYTDHGWKDCLGMTNLLEENPLRKGKPLGGV